MYFFFFKQKTAYEMRISDWSSDVCSSDLPVRELVMLPGTAPRFLRLPGEPARYVALETLLARFSALIFPGYRVKAAAAFRVLRDSDIEIEEEAEDLVRYFANALKRRRRGRVIRLDLEAGLSAELTALDRKSKRLNSR